MSKHIFKLLALVVIAIISTSCGTSSTGDLGKLQVLLHDAPANYDEVNVFIERVEVNDSLSAEGWITINEPQQLYNLLELTNGALAMLGEVELEAGIYNQIRLILSQDGHSVVVDGKSFAMTVPSGSETGIKLNVNAEIKEDIEYTLLLDFDASRSVVAAGNPQNPVQYLLKPVIKATNQALSGNIGGTVIPAEAQPVIYAIAGIDTLSSTYADTTDGSFQLIGLEAGSYTVSVSPTNSNYETHSLSDVEVTVGETNDLGDIELTNN